MFSHSSLSFSLVGGSVWTRTKRQQQQQQQQRAHKKHTTRGARLLFRFSQTKTESRDKCVKVLSVCSVYFRSFGETMMMTPRRDTTF
mmetsp:Transcript_1016/g.3159  ORF Transcript_1016/g.3159 Transcript_1016/m.3159 type:complete len:87 (+) Transcript_1016:121-381(+)